MFINTDSLSMFLTTEETLAILGVSEVTLWKMTHRCDLLKSYKRGFDMRRNYYLRNEVEALLAYAETHAWRPLTPTSSPTTPPPPSISASAPTSTPKTTATLYRCGDDNSTSADSAIFPSA